MYKLCSCIQYPMPIQGYLMHALVKVWWSSLRPTWPAAPYVCLTGNIALWVLVWCWWECGWMWCGNIQSMHPPSQDTCTTLPRTTTYQVIIPVGSCMYGSRYTYILCNGTHLQSIYTHIQLTQWVLMLPKPHLSTMVFTCPHANTYSNVFTYLTFKLRSRRLFVLQEN